jgi:hypothetical protein
MRNGAVAACLVVLIVGVGAQALADATVPSQVSPNTIVLKSKSTVGVTVHADIALRLVSPESVRLNGLEPYAVFADSRGQLVAKFDIDAVEHIVSKPSTTLTLTGVTVDGDTFSGSDTVAVK